MNITCAQDKEHEIPIDYTVEMDHRTTDPMLLDPFSMALRGKREHAMRLATILIDDALAHTYFDPCSEE